MLEAVAEDRRKKAGCKKQLAQRGDRGGACAYPEQFSDVTRRQDVLYSGDLKTARLKDIKKDKG